MPPATITVHPGTRRRIRARALRYLVTCIIPLLAVPAFLRGGALTWAPVAFGFVMIPLLELFMSGKHHNLTEEEEQAALDTPVFDVLLYAIVPLHWALVVLFLFTVGEPGLQWWERAGRIASAGLLCGVYGINVAHELGHRVLKWERDLARILLLSSLYMHFIIEHNRGHHKRVATPDDPASARYGEPVHLFWVRSVVNSWRSAWRIEADQQRRKDRPVLNLRNEMVQAILLQTALVLAILLVFGREVMLAFIAAATIGILLLETVNYIEHYGLRRRKGTQGGYARVLHVHSWNSDHLLGRLFLFELTRHSDHHWKASRKYQILSSHEAAPQMPTGYPGMMVLSLVPPLFFAVMHPRLRKLAASEPGLDLARVG